MPIQTVTLLWKKFTPVEEGVLNCARNILSPKVVEFLEQQLEAVNYVQRRLDWSEVIFYRKIGGVVDWSGIVTLPTKEEIRLFQVDFLVESKRYKATLRCMDGHVFGISFAPGSKGIAFKKWGGEPSIKVLDDPFCVGKPASMQLPNSWMNFLQSMQQRKFPGGKSIMKQQPVV